MDDLVKQLRRIEQNPSPDLWPEVTGRQSRNGQPYPGGKLRNRLAAGLVAAVVSVAAIGILIAVFRPSGRAPIGTVPTRDDVTLIDLGTELYWHGPLVAGDGAMWVVGSGGEEPYEVLRIDPATLEVTDRMSLGFADTGPIPTGLTVGDGSVWVSVARSKDGRWDLLPGELLRVDEATGEIADRFIIPPDPGELAFAYGSVWLAETSGLLARIDPSTGRILDEFEIGRLPDEIVPAFGSLWVRDAYGEGSLVRVDPTDGTVLATFPTVNSVSAGETGMWLQGEPDPGEPIRLIDPATNAVSPVAIALTTRPVYVAQAEGQTWLAAVEEGSEASPPGLSIPGDLRPSGTFGVRPIDPATGAPLGRPIRVCLSAGQPSIAYGALWFPCASKVFHLPLTPSAAAAIPDSTPSPTEGCEPDLAGSWKTTIVPWLSSVLVNAGAPGGLPLTDGDIIDTGSALQISSEVYDGRLDVYVHAGVPDPEHDPTASLRYVGSGNGYKLYSSVSGSESMIQYTAIGTDVWLSVYVYSGSRTSSVGPEPVSNIDGWIQTMMKAVRADPVPSC